MARLGALISALYYPTPSRVMDLITQITKMPASLPQIQPRILDVCAGQGEAVSILAKAWGLSSYGVELDTNRAAKASEVLDACLQGSYHQLQLNPATISVLFLNPPYDTGEDDGVSSRQEIQFLMDSTEWLAPGGLLVFIPPRPILKNAAFVKFMASKYVDIRAWSFPEPEVRDFNQVVVTARKADYHHWRSETDAFRDVDNLPVLGSSGDDYVPVLAFWPHVSPILDSFRLEGINPLDIAPSWENMTHGYGSTQWDVMAGTKGQKVDKPLVAPRPGHQAMLLAAGALDGAEIAYRIPTTNACCSGMPNSAAFCSQCGSRLFAVRLIKGGSEKVTSEIDNDTETLVRERIVSRLSTLDIHTGEHETWRADEETEKTAEWFREHGEELARTILRTHTPEFDGDLAPFEQKLALLTAPGILPGHTKPEILPLQKEAAAAAAFRWKQGFKSTIICGEMGTGKTTCAVVASELAGHKKTIIVCPSHLVPKWIRECEKITKQKGVAVTAKKLSEVDAFFAATDDEDDDFCLTPTKASARFLVLSKETAKLGNRWEPRYTTKKVRVEKEKYVEDEDAPTTYSYYRSYRPMKKVIVKEWLTVVTCPDCGDVQRVEDTYIVPAQMDQKAQRSCVKCKVPLWQMVPMNAKGTVRFPLAAYINKRYARRYSLVIDECFPGDTKVSTPHGDIPIRDIKVGDWVYSKTQEGQIVLRRVTRVLPKKLSKSLVRVTHEEGFFDCTPDHKIWTADQTDYVRAQYLTNTNSLVQINEVGYANQNLSSLSNRFRVCQTHSQGAENVQSPMRGSPQVSDLCAQEKGSASQCDVRVVPESGSGQSGTAKKTFLQPQLSSEGSLVQEPGQSSCLQSGQEHPGSTKGCFGANETNECEPCDQSKDHCFVSGETIQGQKRGQRLYHSRTDVASPKSGMGNGSQYSHGQLEVAGCQGGLDTPHAEACDRVRWGNAPHPVAEEQGPDQNRNVGLYGLDCASLLECPDHIQLDICTPGDRTSRIVRCLSVETIDRREDLVYDLEVEDTHCYFAGGILVSNCHQYAKASSDQAMAIQDLASAASKILAMTGTLYGGRASSIFYLLYKVDFTFRKMYAFSECDRFVQHHGLFETKYETEDRTSVYGYRRSSKRTGGVVREIPGMSPAMIPLLLPYTVFLKLKDLRLELPPYTETIEVVDHVPAVANEAGKMMRDVKDILRKHPRVMGQYLMACLGYPDCPEHAESIEDETAEGNRVVLATARAFDTEVWPKDKRVVEIVTGEKALGRRCLVYFSQTHKRDARQRVKKALEDEGLKVVVLDSNVPPEKREEWLDKACKEGFDVMLTNGRLVETGMDLLFAKTIIQYGTEYSIPSLRQSIRRSWRLGQNEPIRVIFLAYKNTMQEIALNLIARKMRAAEMVDGDETGGLAQFDEAGANFFVELAQEAVSKVA